MSVVVVATFYPKAGSHDAVKSIIATVAPKVHAEPGCELYALHEAADRLVLIEKWESPEALTTHGAGPALASLVADVSPLVDQEIDIVTLNPSPAGDPGRGAL